MKKSVIVVIGLVYIASLIVIGFFGMQVKAYDKPIYVEKIDCINENIHYNSKGDVIIDFIFKEGAPAEQNVVPIKYKVYPENASNRKLQFAFDTNSKVGSVDKNGRVWLKKTGVITVTLMSTDTSNVSITIKIMSKKAI